MIQVYRLLKRKHLVIGQRCVVRQSSLAAVTG